MSSLLFYLNQAEKVFRKKGFEKPRFEAQVLFSELLGMDRTRLFAYDEILLNNSQIKLIKKGIQRRVKDEPLAYILGRKEFYGRNFLVSPAVLIPRPETEELIEIILKSIYPLKNPLNLIDMGAGSGVIGITLGLELFQKKQNFQIWLTDVSKKALKVCKKNLDLQCSQIKEKFLLLKSDRFDEIEKESNLRGFYDVIVSNPPYVLKGEQMDPSVIKFEPKSALIVKNPKIFYLPMFASAFRLLKSGGELWLESSENLIKLQLPWLKTVGFTTLNVVKDYSGVNRFIHAVKNNY